MKKYSFALLSLIMMACGNNNSEKPSPAIAPDDALESRVNEIVSGMSLDDKVGQMCEVTIDLVIVDSLVDGKVQLDPAEVDSVFGKYRVGSVLNTPLGQAQTPETWYRIINGIQEASMKYIGIPDKIGRASCRERV